MSTSETTQQSNIRETTNRRPSGIRVFIVIFLLLHIPLFIYPVLRLCQWLEVNAWLTAAILAPVVGSQVVSRWLLRDAKQFLARRLRYLADFILGLSPIMVLTLLGFELLVMIGLVEPRVAGIYTLIIAGGIAVLGVLIAITPVVRKVSFSSDALTAPLRFVQITDVHIGSRSRSFLERIVAKIRAISPEFVCITGDFIDATGVPASDLAGLKDLACPVYFSIGNHERYEDLEDIIERLESLGVIVLRTDSVQYRDDVQVIGIDDRDDAMQVERELSRLKVREDAFGLLLYHRPRGLEAAERAGIDLMISGHTHAGQIFPFNLVVNRVFDRAVGMYERGRSRLYVSQGTGTWGPVMRVGTRSEITLFEIESMGQIPGQGPD